MLRVTHNKLWLTLYLIIALVIVLILPETRISITVQGLILVLTSVVSLYSFRNDGKVVLLLAVLAVVNVAVSYGNYLNIEDFAYNWQVQLINTHGQYMMCKSFVIFYICVLFGIVLAFIRMSSRRSSTEIDNTFYAPIGKLVDLYDKNLLVFIGGFLLLIFILIFGFDRTISGSYASASNAIYEYAPVVFLFVWLFMPKKNYYKGAMLLYAAVYIIQGLIFGDRSSAFPMLLLCYALLRKDNIRIRELVPLSILGIFGANLIGIYRVAYSATSDIIAEVASRLLYVDSVSYSFYAGVQIVRASEVMNNRISYFFDWLISLFKGDTASTALAPIVKEFSSQYYNGGGGTSSAYFYFWFGLAGSIIGGIVIGYLIGFIFTKRSNFAIISQILIFVFALRWYVYYPQSLLRTSIFLPLVIYGVISLFNTLVIRRGKGINVRLN